jgi:hypothetical protein
MARRREGPWEQRQRKQQVANFPQKYSTISSQKSTIFFCFSCISFVLYNRKDNLSLILRKTAHKLNKLTVYSAVGAREDFVNFEAYLFF